MMAPRAEWLWTYWIGSALLWVGLSVIVYRRWRLPQKPSPWIILGVAAAARLGVALSMPPVLSDDVWRYVFDGALLSDGINPYAHSPQEAIDAVDARHGEGDTAWWANINNPELVTIYQPTSQWIFAGIVKAYKWTHGVATPLGGAERWFRITFSLFDLLIVLLLMRQLRLLGRSPWWAVMYAWSPLVIYETAGSGHQDAMGIAAVIGAILFAQRCARSWPYTVLAGVTLGLAVGVKPIVLPIALPMAWFLRGEHAAAGRIVAAGASCVVTLLALYVPFALMDGGIDRMLETSRYFVEAWRFNGSLHPLLELAFGSKWVADVVLGVLLAAVLVAAMVFHRVPWRAATTYFFAMVCASSTAHPWYLLWALALMPVSWSAARTVVAPAVWVASLTLPWSYAAWLSLEAQGEYQPSLAVQLAIWIPIYAAVIFGAVTLVRSRRAAENGSMNRVIGGRG